MSKNNLNFSLIITTYNRPDALGLILQALNAQQNSPYFEIIIADDGSTRETQDLIHSASLTSQHPIRHFWQPDQGFRAARVRNQAIALANGDYLIFLDGDCVPLPSFVYEHAQLAEANHFVVGHRVLLNATLTAQVINQQLPIWSWSLWDWTLAYLQQKINRLLPLLPLNTLSLFRKLPIKSSNYSIFKHKKCPWQGAKTCNLGIWRSNIIKINGFNEDFQGWGHEDAEMVIRLLRSGIARKEGRFRVPVLHLWHPQADRGQTLLNQQRLEQAMLSKNISVNNGLLKLNSDEKTEIFENFGY